MPLVKVSIKIVHVNAIYCSRIECIRYSFHPCSNPHSTPKPKMCRNKAIEWEIFQFIFHKYESFDHPYFMSNQNSLIYFEFCFTFRNCHAQWRKATTYMGTRCEFLLFSSECVNWRSQKCQRILPELDEVCVHW